MRRHPRCPDLQPDSVRRISEKRENRVPRRCLNLSPDVLLVIACVDRRNLLGINHGRFLGLLNCLDYGSTHASLESTASETEAVVSH
jgi:hypothetical protein